MFMLGLTVSLGSSGVIALAAMFYPTVMRSAGTGWVMAMGRFGQVCAPLVIGLLLAFSWPPLRVLAVMAGAPFLAGMCLLAIAGVIAGRPSAVVAGPLEARKPA
jgi:AAHS family 4-hydroxybenzoate transporter-like MFS transporter